MEDKVYYLILSEGSYSDYSPTYFVGRKEVTQEQLDEVSKQVGDRVIAEFEELPEAEYVCDCLLGGEHWNWCKYKIGTTVKLKDGKQVSQPDVKDWFDYMHKWLEENGFVELPPDIPEVNTNYSIPHN
jgi:hypothetical protein